LDFVLVFGGLEKSNKKGSCKTMKNASKTHKNACKTRNCEFAGQSRMMLWMGLVALGMGMASGMGSEGRFVEKKWVGNAWKAMFRPLKTVLGLGAAASVQLCDLSALCPGQSAMMQTIVRLPRANADGGSDQVNSLQSQLQLIRMSSIEMQKTLLEVRLLIIIY
jgi:hypothetical protein